MSETAVTILIYAGLGLVVAIAIFAGALWFANRAKRGNLRFKRMQQRTDPAATETKPAPE